MADSSDGAGGAKVALSPEEIAEVKKNWEEQQRRKKEKEAAKEKDKGDKEEGKDSESKDANKKKKDILDTLLIAPTPSPPTAKHQRFTLHRDVFALRLAEHRKRRQAAQAKSLAPKLPSAPQGGLS